MRRRRKVSVGVETSGGSFNDPSGKQDTAVAKNKEHTFKRDSTKINNQDAAPKTNFE